MNKKSNTFHAFTLIEMLIVLGIIGILSGIFINTINARHQQEIATDAQRRQKLKESVDLVEGFRVAEGHYPDEGTNNNPLDSTADDQTLLENYLSEWYPGLIYNVDGDTFSIHIESAVTTNVYKYSSVWSSIRECSTTDSEYDMNDPSECDWV